jgi:hypothetical protein
MKAKTAKLFATLVRGQTYTLIDRAGGKDLVFVQGEPQEVTPKQHDWLRLHAVDRVTCLDIETDDIVPVAKGASLDGIGRTVSKDVAKFRFTSEPAKAA